MANCHGLAGFSGFYRLGEIDPDKQAFPANDPLWPRLNGENCKYEC